MHEIKDEEVQSLLRKLRQSRQNCDEAIAILEHMMHLQYSDRDLECYDPDDYLERWVLPAPIPTSAENGGKSDENT